MQRLVMRNQREVLDMSSALEYVRNGCGQAGEEVADEYDAMELELAKANDIIRRCKNVMECNDPMNYRLIFGDA